MGNISYHASANGKGEPIIIVEVAYSYLQLVARLLDAAKRAANTKGIERHAVENQAFEDQLICEAQRMLGSIGHGGPRFQAIKKIIEAGRLDKDAAINELQDAICYLAADILVLEEEISEKEDAYEAR